MTTGLDVTTLRGRRAVSRATRLSVGDTFERIRWSRPDAVVITGFSDAYEQHRELTATEADDLANRFARAVLAAGTEPGEIVVVACENSVEAMLVKIGLAKAGVVAAPINPKLAPDVVTEMLELTGAKHAVLDAEFWPALRAPLAAAGTDVLTAIAIGGTEPVPAPTFAGFIRDHPPTEPDVHIHGDDIWQILFTSGTSASPKGVLVPHVKTVLEALSMTGTLTRGLRHEHDIVLGGFLPIIYHVGDVTVFSALLAGGRVVLGRHAAGDQLADAAHEQRITAIWAGSPQVVQGVDAAVRAAPHLDLSCVTSIVFGFAPLRPAAYASLRAALGDHVACVEIIGQTEICCCHRFFLGEHRELYERAVPRHNYVGLPHPLMATAIVDESGTPLPACSPDIGEAVYRSPAVTPGYYRDPAATAKAMRNGWFHGGDAFGHGEAGQRVLVDRFKDIVKTGGENVSSVRVEQVLMQHPAVARAAVIGVPHDRWGEAVTAVVTLHTSCDTGELIAFCRSRLAGFEIPKEVVVVAEFPEAVGGKIRKNVLRERYRELHRAAPSALPVDDHRHGDRCYWDHTQARWVCPVASPTPIGNSTGHTVTRSARPPRPRGPR